MKTLVRLSLTMAFIAASAVSALGQCTVPDNGTGTVTLPPAGCGYLSPTEVHMIIDGLPPGTTIELAPIHQDFICRQSGLSGCPPAGCEAPGGSLGGNVDCFDSVLQLAVRGTGDLTSFNRSLLVPVQCQVHTGPRNPGDAVQDFDTEMVQLQGSIFGDPDFDMLSIRAGSGNGLPSPGHTTLTRLGPPGSSFQVDSFFDIAYEIDFQGATGSVLEGLSGITNGTVRMQTPTVNAQAVPSTNVWGQILVSLLVLGTGIFVLQRRVLA